MSSREDKVDELEDLVGRVFANRYVLEKFLDRGAFGAVYRGTDNKFNQTVAVKVGSSSREFMKEARLASEVKHPNIVLVSDYGSDGGMAYLVMEYLHGDNLDALFQSQGRKLSPEHLRKFVYEVGDALACAHADNLIHCDLKPKNVILREHISKSGVTTGGSKFVLLDFGIASKLNSEGTLANLTFKGAGTVEYMAPELFGKSPLATQQSDIYAFGVILYQMMTGRVPFPQGDNGLMALSACISAILEQPVPRFQEIASDRNFPPGIEALILQCLEKDPTRRPETVAEVRRRFLKIYDPILDPIEKKQAAPHQNRSTSSLIGVISLVVLVVAGLFLTVGPTRDIEPSDERKPNVRTDDPVPRVLPQFVLKPLKIDLPTAETRTFEVSCPNLPDGARFEVLPEDFASFGIHTTVMESNKKPSTWEMSVHADPRAEPIDRVLLLSVKVVERDSIIREEQLSLHLRLIWLPIDFEAVDAAKVTLAEGRNYFSGIRRRLSGAEVEFVLVEKPDGYGDPGSFYLMRDKVSRELFHIFLEENRSSVSQSRQRDIAAGWAKSGEMTWPVTGVTAAEAIGFAEWLGGKLPTRRQWDRASGYDFVKPTKGCIPPASWDPMVWKSGPFREQWESEKKGIALSDFMPVGASSNDVSYCGARDMAGNGTEFLRDTVAVGQFPLVYLRGKSVGGLNASPLEFKDFDANPSQPWEAPHQHTGFRIVIER